MESAGHGSGPLSGKIIALIGRLSPPKRKLQQMIEDLGSEIWQKKGKKLPTDLILAPGVTKKSIKIQAEIGDLTKKGAKFETHNPQWLLNFQRTKNSEKHNAELLGSTGGRTESSIRIPSRQIVPVTPPLADRWTERAREGHENLCSMKTDPAIRTIIPKTLPSNSLDKVTTSIVKPICTSQYAPVDAYNRVIERPRVLYIDKTSPSPPRRAVEMDVKSIPDVSSYYNISRVK
jgi:hypothetical protein